MAEEQGKTPNAENQPKAKSEKPLFPSEHGLSTSLLLKKIDEKTNMYITRSKNSAQIVYFLLFIILFLFVYADRIANRWLPKNNTEGADTTIHRTSTSVLRHFHRDSSYIDSTMVLDSIYKPSKPGKGD